MTTVRQVKLVSNVHPYVKEMCKEENSTAHLHAQQGFFLKLDPTSNEFVTGYNLPYGLTDEEVLGSKKSSDPGYKYKDLVLERLRLEKALRRKLTGGPENQFLEDFHIVLKERGKSDKVLNLDKPKDLFTYRALIANGVAAPDYASTLGTTSSWVPYYFEDAQKKEETQKAARRVRNVLRGILANQDENKVWLYAISRLIGLEPSHEMSVDSLYASIDGKLSEEESLDRLKEWETTFKLPIADLERIAIWYVGIYAMYIIRGTNGNGYYIDSVNMGDSQDQVIANFGDEKFQESYLKVREKVYSKLGIFK